MQPACYKPAATASTACSRCAPTPPPCLLLCPPNHAPASPQVCVVRRRPAGVPVGRGHRKHHPQVPGARRLHQHGGALGHLHWCGRLGGNGLAVPHVLHVTAVPRHAALPSPTHRHLRCCTSCAARWAAGCWHDCCCGAPPLRVLPAAVLQPRLMRCAGQRRLRPGGQSVGLPLSLHRCHPGGGARGSCLGQLTASRAFLGGFAASAHRRWMAAAAASLVTSEAAGPPTACGTTLSSPID